MAPLGTVDMSAAWLSSPEVGIISVVVFVILSIALLVLCAQCRRRNGNAYDVSGATTDGSAVANGTTDAKTGNTNAAYTTWRSHKDMPNRTLEQSPASVSSTH